MENFHLLLYFSNGCTAGAEAKSLRVQSTLPSWQKEPKYLSYHQNISGHSLPGSAFMSQSQGSKTGSANM